MAGFVVTAAAGELSGNISIDARYFPEDVLDNRQHDSNLSAYAQPEFYTEWADGRQALTIEPFLRIDEHDDERTHFDLRELNWLLLSDDWEWRIGLSKVFWGVTESQHLVDIINQTDNVENIDGEDKLGQPMIHATWLRDWGAAEFFVLPGFRERTFPGVEGRPRAPFVVDTDNPDYESSREESHIDWAVRLKASYGPWDIGVSHFNGTAREPRFLPAVDATGQSVLIPRYDLIDQTGLDTQAILGDWLLKLETIYQSNPIKDFTAAVGGFEYTFVGVFESAIDLGVLAEYHYDDRGEDAGSIFQDDVFTGFRLAFNDTQSSEILAGAFVDRDYDSESIRIEASRRLGDSWKIELQYQSFSNADSRDPSFAFRNDDHFQLDLGWFF